MFSTHESSKNLICILEEDVTKEVLRKAGFIVLGGLDNKEELKSSIYLIRQILKLPALFEATVRKADSVPGS